MLMKKKYDFEQSVIGIQLNFLKNKYLHFDKRLVIKGIANDITNYRLVSVAKFNVNQNTPRFQ